jgi:uroporphyrinogen decarboxylase
VQIFDTWCGELTLADYRAFVLPAVHEIVSAVRGAAPIIYYTKASHHLLSAVIESGADVLSCDWRVNLAELRKLAGPKIALQGNLDPAVLFSPQDHIRKTTHEIVRQLGGVGHILNLGHGILPATPVENAQTFISAGQQFLFSEKAAGQ